VKYRRWDLALTGLEAYMRSILLAISLSLLVACGTVQHKVNFKSGYAPKQGTKIEVGKVSNDTGSQFKIDIEQLLRDSLSKKLKKVGVLYDGNGNELMTVDTKIIEYSEGNAFGRWLLPSSSATVLSIQSDLREGAILVGSVDARGTVSSGGLYSVGAWKYIFDKLSKDVVTELVSKIPK
jgi:hypothetical protein